MQMHSLKNIKLKRTLQLFITSIILLLPSLHFAQAPTLATAASFVLFTSNGAVSNMGITRLTGNVGTNSGSSTAFGNIDGVIHDGDGTSAATSANLLVAYNQLNAAIPTIFPAPLLGNGQTLTAGVHSISGNATLDNTLTLNAQGNENAVFIIQIQGAFSTTAASKVVLTNGALACNVYWKIEGLVSLATNSTIRGTIVANNSAIIMGSGVTIEGRALSTNGAITVNGLSANTPIGCGSPVLTGPAGADLKTAACYTLFSGSGPVTNTGVTYVIGDVGTNSGLTTGFDPSTVTGTIHPIPDASTAAAAADLSDAYTYLSTLTHDIELLYPAQFGNSLVLTPHTYLLDGATTFTDTLFLNAQGNPDAVFVIKINGALITSTYATVVLRNGAQSKNVYWMVEGAVNINGYSRFAGTIVCNNGAITGINPGSILDGRALTTTGALNTSAIATTLSFDCATVGINDNQIVTENVASIYPNPWTASFMIDVSDPVYINNSDLQIYNITGTLVYATKITKSSTLIEPVLSAGMYVYRIISNNKTVQSGKLVSQ